MVVVRQIEPPQEIQAVLAPNEKLVGVFGTLRDYVAFTTKRVILTDVQGITGRGREIYSFPISQIEMWSTETKGMVDVTSEITIWTRSVELKVVLTDNKIVHVIDRVLASAL